jgi:hypothetical protein
MLLAGSRNCGRHSGRDYGESQQPYRSATPHSRRPPLLGGTRSSAADLGGNAKSIHAQPQGTNELARIVSHEYLVLPLLRRIVRSLHDCNLRFSKLQRIPMNWKHTADHQRCGVEDSSDRCLHNGFLLDERLLNGRSRPKGAKAIRLGRIVQWAICSTPPDAALTAYAIAIRRPTSRICAVPHFPYRPLAPA